MKVATILICSVDSIKENKVLLLFTNFLVLVMIRVCLKHSIGLCYDLVTDEAPKARKNDLALRTWLIRIVVQWQGPQKNKPITFEWQRLVSFNRSMSIKESGLGLRLDRWTTLFGGAINKVGKRLLLTFRNLFKD